MRKDFLEMETETACCVRCGARDVRLGAISSLCERCWDANEATMNDNGVPMTKPGRWLPALMRGTVRERLPGQPAIIARALGWRPTPEKSIAVIHGVTGTGKTRLMCLMLERLETEHKLTPKIWWAGELGIAITAAWTVTEGGMARLLRESIEADVLALDDFDKVKVTERLGEFLFSVIDARTRSGRPTIITTNLTGPKLQAQFSCEVGPALLRRIKEHGLGFAP